MTMRLPFDCRADGACTLLPEGRSPQRAAAEDDISVAIRPPIPDTVITWSNADLVTHLPIGAGDPATAAEGPAGFRVLDARPLATRIERASVDTVLFGVLVVMLLGLGGAIAKSRTDPNTAWAPRDPAAVAAIGKRKIAAVELRVTRLDAVPPAQSD